MSVDTTRNGMSVHNILTGQTGTVIHAEGGQYLVELDKLTLRGEYRQWWRASHIALRGNIGDAVAVWTEQELRDEIRYLIGALHTMPEYRDPKWFEGGVDYLDYLTTVLEYEFQGGRESANEGVVRANVRWRLTPQRWVSIPGLGREVPIYEGDAA